MAAGTIARRTFLIGSAAIAGGLAVGYYYVQRPYDNPLADQLSDGEATFNPYVKIAADETITVVVPRAEMGQGVATSLAALVAEELEVPLERVTVEHGPASHAYYNAEVLADGGPFAFFDEGMVASGARAVLGAAGKLVGIQGTGGSTSMRDGFDKMRKAGAAARHVLIEAAAAKLGAPRERLTLSGGTITDPETGRTATYGALASAAAAITPPSDPQLKPRAAWTLLGKPQKRVDMLAKVTGAPIFGMDVELPDMLHGTVRMSPRFGARAVRADTTRAQAVPGVVKVVPLDSHYGSGFGVIAENSWAAFRGADALEIEWEAARGPADSEAFAEILRDAARSGNGWSLRDDGDVDTDFADAPRARLLEALYEVPLLAHAAMEPLNATARLKDGRLDVWSPNQVPTLTRQWCAAAAGIEEDRVEVHTTFLGGGFGRRLEVDYSVYAALLARETGGRPVKVTWTREEDMRHDVYRPASVGLARARLGSDGLPEALELRVASPSVVAGMMSRLFPALPAVGPDKTISEGAHDQPYAIPSYRVTAIATELPVPIGSWRSVGHSFNAFFHESFMDEIAVQGGIDPVELRRRLMAQHPAAVSVIEKVAQMSGWGSALPQGRARGFAFCLSFGSWVAEVVEIAETGAGIRIDKVFIAADVGTAIDPGIIEAQLVSGAIFGLSAAMGQEITVAEGMVEQSNFHDFDAMRIYQCPRFEVAILENYHRMGGVGEIGTPPAAPALANAVFALTGRRIRRLPLAREVGFV